MQQISQSMKHTLIFHPNRLLKLKYAGTETGYKGPKLEAALLVKFKGQMEPRSDEFQHPAAPIIIQYVTQGCEVSCGREWTKTHMEVAANKGSHPSAWTQDTIVALKVGSKRKIYKEPMQAHIMIRGKR